METKASYMIVGSFTLVLLAGLVSAVVWLAGVELKEEFAYYDLYFKGSVTGLKVGNPVRYRGVPVGQVTDIRIDPDNVEQVKVTIEVPSDTPIKEDSIASLEYQGITGVAFVQIEGGTQEAPTLARVPGKGNPVINSKPSQLQEVIDQAPELLNRFIALVNNANKLLGPENQKNFSIAMGNIKTITGAVADSSEDIHTVLTEGASTIRELRKTAVDARKLVQTVQTTLDTMTSDVSGTLGEARSAIGSIRDLSSSLSGQVKGLGPDARKSILALKQAADSLNKSQEELAAMIQENREPLANFTSSGLYEITQLVSEARVLVGGLSRITGQFERDPARFLFGDSQQGVGVRR